MHGVVGGVVAVSTARIRLLPHFIEVSAEVAVPRQKSGGASTMQKFHCSFRHHLCSRLARYPGYAMGPAGRVPGPQTISPGLALRCSTGEVRSSSALPLVGRDVRGT